MEDSQFQASCKWYSERRPTYKGLSDLIRSTLDGLLRREEIDFLGVSSRTKSPESFAEKLQRKGYTDPQKQMTDLSGIRVITFIESDVGRVAELIKRSFHVLEENSIDKAAALEVDRFGYRSVHLVCDLGTRRAKLPEFSVYKSLLFEIQVRTVLQHAWAEIEHDRNYKLSGVLPAALRRRLHAIAGMFEIADREFSSIAAELDLYTREIALTAKKGTLDIELNSATLKEFMISKKPKLHSLGVLTASSGVAPEVVRELRDFGITSLTRLDAILTLKFLTLFSKHKPSATPEGLLRAAMMAIDLRKYFHCAWNRHWTGISSGTFGLLCEIYGVSEVKAMITPFVRLPTEA